jgi:hypothetical protein
MVRGAQQYESLDRSSEAFDRGFEVFKTTISMRAPYSVLFLNQDKHARLKSLWDMRIHNACIPHNLRYVVLTQFAQLYSHPKGPFQVHLWDRHVHIVYIQYMYRKFLQRAT